MVLPNPPSNNTPIQNNPFYSDETAYFRGPYYNALVTPTSGIQVNTNGTITVTGGGGGSGTVTAVTAVSPLSVINSTTTPVISVSASSTTAVGVVRLFDGTNSTSTSEALTANQGYILQQQINALTVSSNLTLAGTINAATGLLLTVTSDGAAEGFTVGFPLPPASSGNNSYFAIITTPGTMTPPGGSATVCNQGDWWLSDGTSWSIIDNAPAVPAASLTTQGIVQLYDGVNSTSITCAATPNSIKTAYDVAAAAMPVAGGTFTGPVTFSSSALFNGATVYCSANTFCGPTAFCCPTTFNATSTFCCPVTFCCTPVLPAGVALGCAACVTYNNSTSGLTATNVQTAIDQVKALTASAIPCSCVTGKGALITGTGAAAPVALAVGTNGQYLAANSACANGLNWVTATNGTVTAVSAGTGLTGGTITSSGVLALDFSCVVAASILTAKGSIVVASAPASPAALAVGTNGQYLSVNSLCSSGLTWVTPTTGTLTSVTAGTGLTGGTITSTGTIALDTACVLSPTLLTAKGAIISASAASTPSTITVGTNGQVLTACSTCTGGLTWSTQSVSAATPTVAGTVFGCTTIATSCNASLGYRSLLSNTSGCFNIAVGAGSLVCNTTGYFNTALGWRSLVSTISGIYNTGVGAASLFQNITGLCNTGVGYEALYNSKNCGNTGVGFGAARGVTTGCLNAAVGACALYNVDTGSCNVGIGPWVQVASGTGSCQLAIGFSSSDNWLTGRSDKSIQPGAGLRDNTGALGTSGQVLTSTGTGIAWGATSSGTLTSITAGTGLTGGTITTSGIITLNSACVISPTIVTAKGSLISASTASTPVELTVGTNGQVLSACSTCSNGLTWVTPANGTVTAVTGTLPISVTAGNTPVVSIAAASTTATGSVQLYDNTNSTSTALALTAAQGKNLQDQINALGVTSNLTLAGTFNATTGLLLTVTSAGTAAGFTVGSNLPSAAAGNIDYFVIVTTGGSYNPPGGGGPYTASQGDWFLSTGTAWSFLNVGAEPNYASTTTAGVVCLSTNALAQTGTDTLTALTPATGASAYVFKSCYTAKGAILGGSAASTPTALSVGTDGQRLTACAACATGLVWATPTSGTVISVSTGTGLSGGPITSSGTVSLANTAVTPGSYTYANITVDAQGRLTAATSGASPTGGTVSSVATGTGLSGGPVTSTGTISLANTAVSAGSYTYGSFTVDAQGRLTAASSGATPICTSDILAKGNLIVGTAVSAICALGVGTDAQVLTACSACASGVTWATGASPASAATPTVKGIVFGCTTANNAALGCNALLSNTTGFDNTAMGRNALNSNTSGNQNTASGLSSLYYNTLGCRNTATGTNALAYNTTGNYNTSYGYNSGCSITTGSCNVTIGNQVQVASVTGSCQLSIGFNSTQNWLTGNSTKAIKPGAGIIDCANSCGTAGQVLMSNGSNAICWGTAGGGSPATPQVAGIVLGCTTLNNAALGCQALVCNTTGNLNVSVGSQSLCLNTTGSTNTAVGWSALCTNTTGQRNVAIGANSMRYNTTGVSNSAVGEFSLNFNNGFDNSALGSCSLQCNTSGSLNTAVGSESLRCNTTGLCNTGVGLKAGCSITTGCSNVAIGDNVQVASPTGSCQLSIGFASGSNWLTGNSTKAIKPGAGVIDCANSCGTAGQVLMSNGANAICWGTAGGGGGSPATPTVAGIVFGRTPGASPYSTGLGWYALQCVTTGVFNVSIGYRSGFNITTGDNNVSTGKNALTTLTTGLENLSLGNESLAGLTTGCYNTAVGNCALLCNLTTSSYNVGIGRGVLLPSGNCQLAIGFTPGPVGTGAVSCYWLTGCSDLSIRPGKGIRDCTNTTGTAGQVLMSNGANAVCWGTAGGGSAATPLVAGIVFGLTQSTLNLQNTSLGYGSLSSLTTGCYNVALGAATLTTTTTGILNIGVGFAALVNNLTGGYNVSVGACALYNNTTGCFNTAVGANALACATSDRNVAIGTGAGGNVSTGCGNVLVGTSTGSFITTGGLNTFIGEAAGQSPGSSLITGSGNVAIGYNACLPSATNSCQLVIGYCRGCNWLTGCSDKSIKPGAGIRDCADATGTAGQVLMSNGANAVCWGTGGGSSSPATPISAGVVYGCTVGGCAALGQCALKCNTSGVYNTALGFVSMQFNTTGNYNTAVGAYALCCNTTGCYNTATGYLALNSNTTGCYSVAIGFCALDLNTTGKSNIAIGSGSLMRATTGIGNVAVGDVSGESITTGGRNTLVGAGAGSQIITGSNNVIVGQNPVTTMGSNVSNNIVIGTNIDGGGAAGSWGTSSYSVAIGNAIRLPASNLDGQLVIGSGLSGCPNWLTGCPNGDIQPGAAILDCDNCSGTADQVLRSTGGGRIIWSSFAACPLVAGILYGCTCAAGGPTALGYCSLGGTGSPNTRTTAIGNYALINGGCEDVGVGWCSGSGIRGQGNVYVGAYAGSSTSGGTGASFRGHVAIGYKAMCLLSSATACNNITIGCLSGADALCNLTGQCNLTIIGNNATTCFISKVALTTPSDLRWKKVTGDVPLALPFVESLTPIKYQFCDKETGEVTDDRYRYGFSAQEILANEENPDHPIIVGIDNPDMYSVSETMLFPVLVNAIKELSAEVKLLKAEVAALKTP